MMRGFLGGQEEYVRLLLTETTPMPLHCKSMSQESYEKLPLRRYREPLFWAIVVSHQYNEFHGGNLGGRQCQSFTD